MVRAFGRTRRAAVIAALIAARAQGVPRAVHVRLQVILLLQGETTPRRARMRAAAVLAAANSGTIRTIGFILDWFTLEGEAARLPPCRRLHVTGCVIAGCVGHTSVHSDRGPHAWGSGGRARCVEQQQQRRSCALC
jgi:hypothetical protein